MSKNIELNDGRKITINVFQNENEYYVYAKDQNNNQIGRCIIYIWHQYIRTFTDDERRNYANRLKINIDKAPREHIVKRKKRLEDYNHEGSSAILINKYKYNTSICQLFSIEIFEEEYVGAGVGSIMLKEAEGIAIDNGCKVITARYLPSGPFAHKSRDFYLRNNYKFYKEDCTTCVKKSLLEHNKYNGWNV